MTNHVNELTKSVSQKLYQLSKTFQNAHARELFFHANIQPIIDYVSILWDSVSRNTIKPLASIHKQSLTARTPSTLKFNFHSNQNRHSHKLTVPRPRLDLFNCSFMYSGENLWNNLSLLINIFTNHKAFKKAFLQYLMEKSQHTLLKDM